ncbi:hypothetical protein NCC49_006250 [Naganishia albida]|nr:hypothetical protein NCC49_006250 [Naganishia albida]
MDALGLPTSFGRTAPGPVHKPRQQNNPRGGRGKGNQHARRGANPYPAPAPSATTADGGGHVGPLRGRGRARGGGGGGTGRGGARGANDPRGPPPGQRPGFSKEQTEFGTAFYSDSFFENPWAALESKS